MIHIIHPVVTSYIRRSGNRFEYGFVVFLDFWAILNHKIVDQLYGIWTLIITFMLLALKIISPLRRGKMW